MRKILTILISLISFIASAQTPTYRWISGSQESRKESNLVLTEPGPRNGLSSFTDTNGDFWIFGGNGNDFTTTQGFLNDTWKYEQSSGQWEWISGQMSVDRPVNSGNNSLSFDGVDDIVELNENPLDYTQDLTIEVWFKPAQDGVIMSYSRDNISDDFAGWRFQIGNNGESFWITSECCLEAQINELNLFDQEWHHLAVVFEKGDDLFVGNKLSVYLDETLIQESRALANSGTDVSSHKTFIGGFKGDNGETFFTGQIDEVRFWDYPRNKGEITSNRTIELSGDEEGLVAYYNFNQGIINSAGNNERELIDATGSINGTLSDNIYREGLFIGQMAEVRVWSSFLDQKKIRDLASIPVNGTELEMKMAYDFSNALAPGGDNTATTSITDLTGTNEGFLSNFGLMGNASNFIETKLATLPSSYSNHGGATIAVTEDFNEDGFDDIITNTNNRSFTLFINDQLGGFSPFTEFDVVNDARDLTVGQFNNDSHFDVAIAAHDSDVENRIRVYFGDGTGDFPSFVDIDPGDYIPNAISSEDMNGDLVEDLIVLLPKSSDRFDVNEVGEVHIYYSDGFGSFGSPDVFHVGNIYSENIAVGDFNNDNLPDISYGLYTRSVSGTVKTIGMLLNDGDGSFDKVADQYYRSQLIEEIYAKDINQDGNMDLIATQGGILGTIFGNGDGTFQEMIYSQFEDFFKELTFLALNADNEYEVLISHQNTNDYNLFTIDKDGVFTKIRTFETSSSPRQIAVSDLDKNGFLDFIVPTQNSELDVLLVSNREFVRNVPVVAIDFDGINDYIDIPNLKPFDADFTWEGWVNTEDNGPIFSFTENDVLADWNAGQFTLAIKDSRLTFMVNGYPDIQADNEYPITNGEWHHVAVAVDINIYGDETVILYIDGIEVGFGCCTDFNTSIDNANGDFYAKLGYASNNFKDIIGTTAQSPLSNWVDGVEFPSAENGRAYNAYWNDEAGDFFIFGGQGKNGIYNSIRKYDKSNQEWLTIKGSDIPNDGGNYGIKGIANAANIPPARYAVSAATDPNGNIWTFGGAANETPTGWFNDLWKYNPSTNEWAWVSGESIVNQLPQYGELGVSNPENMPGPREHHKTWSDAQGDIWIFGGFGIDAEGETGYLNDLWKFDVITLEWTWVSGNNIADHAGVFGAIDEYNTTNHSGGRSASIQWMDSDGIVWIFGGQGIDKFGISVGYLNDLWSYDPNSNQWAWHSGSDFAGSTGSYNETGLSSVDYVPGARWHSTGWVDEKNNLWLYGGYKYNQISTGLYNDFWKYTPKTKEWTWLNGFNSTANTDQIGVYGDINEASSPHPGSRHGGLTWTDIEGDFWMLGGAEIGNDAYGSYNDLWKYEPQKEKWQYLLGDTKLSLNDGVYGSKGIGSDTNDPKSRWHGSSWTGQDGKLWFFGGINHNKAIEDIAWLNDLWYFDPESKVYTWVGGSSTINTSGVYGVKGEASSGHIPGARSSSAYWSDEDGNFWLFGGYESFEYNNDLWRFNPSTLEWTWVSGDNFQNAPGIYGQKGVTDPTNSIGARRYTDGKIDQDGNVWVFGGDGHDQQAQRGFLGDLWKYEPSSNSWTWMAGSESRNTYGNFGVQGVPSPDNAPPPRYGHSSWIDDSGNLWILGGYGILDDGAGNRLTGDLNDLWKYDVITNLWTWVDGSDEIGNLGVYEAQDEFSINNMIPSKARAQAFGTVDKSLWVFGGRQGRSASYNDFWQIKFNPGLPYVKAPSDIHQTEFTFSYDEPWAREYQIQVALTDDFSDIFFDEITSDTQIPIGNLQPGTFYNYRVNAINEIGQSGFSQPTQVLTLPVTPTFASLELALASLSSTQVYLDWEVTEGIVDGYFIDISTDIAFSNTIQVHEDFNTKLIPVGQRQEILNLTPGTQYYTRLQSFNTSGTSPYSEVIPFLTKPATPTYTQTSVVSEITQSSVLLSWNEVPEILDGYQLTISTLDDGFQDPNGFLPIYNGLDIPKKETSIRVSGIEPGSQYYGYLVAVNSSGESDQSEKISLLTTPASPVFNLQSALLSITQDEVTFNWEAPQGFYEGYLLEVSTDFTFANPNLMLDGYGQNGIPMEVAQSELTHTVAGLASGQTYFARIKAVNTSGKSPNSNTLPFTTVPSAPELNRANNITQQSASVSWTSTTGSAVYLIDLNTTDTFEDETSIFRDFPLAVPFRVIEDLEPGLRYHVRVQGSNGSGSSGTMDPPDYGHTSFITIPSTPILDVVSNYTQNSFDVSWAEVRGASGYIVDASDNFFQTFLTGFNEKQVTNNRVTISGLSPGVTYQVRVRSNNESGDSPNAILFDLETLPATPISRDASSISTSVFTAHWDPATGADFYTLEVSQDDFQTFHYNEQLTTANPLQMTGLIAGATYSYRVKAGNTSGTSPYSNVNSVVAQNNAQSLNISNIEFDENFQDGTNSSTVTATLSGGQGDPEVLIRYKGILGSNWSESIDMDGSGTTFTFDITDSMLDEVGIEFEIFGNDNITFVESLGNKIKRSFNESQSSELPSLVFNDWQMIAIPYELENKQVTAVFNELNSLEYKKQWRLMHYQDEAYLDAITGFANIEIGLGYWLNVISEASINVGAGKANAEIPFKITLKQGWNQIGNPFNTSVNWSQVRSDNGAFGRVDNPFIYDINQKTFISSTILQPFAGAYVWADEEIQLDVTPASSNGRIANVAHHLATVENENWQLPIVFKSNEKTFQIAGVGMYEGASDLKDSFDRLAPPKFENYTEMVTTKSEAVYPYFHTDITSLKAEQIWNFTLSSNHFTGEVALEWDNFQLNKYFGLWLVNEKTGKVIDMKSNSQHSFYLSGGSDFSIHYSENPNYAVLPKLLSLGEPFPNPASNYTTIPLMLPNRETSYQIDLSVFDLNGRKVKTVANGEYQNGFHLIDWNPGEEIEIKNGIYFYRLSFQNEATRPITKKLIIKK
jgi:N-acetylneuraminic acid mutarotase